MLDISFSLWLYSRAMKKFTVFSDMFSGGSQKESFKTLAVALPEREAVAWFTDTFGDPFHVSCHCCGSDFFVSEEEFDHDDEFEMSEVDVVVFDPKGFTHDSL